MNTYKTAQVAQIVGVHPNTVRLYEELGLIPKARREANGYRIFTDFHIDVFKLARIAFQIEILQNGLRKKIVLMVKTAAAGDFDKAISLTRQYRQQVHQEKENAAEAIQIVKEILSGNTDTETVNLRRAETAKRLLISMDTLRNWEMNGLLSVKRRANGYRIYTGEDLNRLKIIRSLRCANYSLEAILRLLSEQSVNPDADIEKMLDTPQSGEEIISVYDKLLTSLGTASENAEIIEKMLFEMKNKY